MRAFNRFYTEVIDSLDEAHEGLDVTLTQSRLLFAIRELGSPDVGELARRLGLEIAFTSRCLSALEERDHIERAISPRDRRRHIVQLTKSGTELLAEIERRSDARMLALVDHLDREQLVP